MFDERNQKKIAKISATSQQLIDDIEAKQNISQAAKDVLKSQAAEADITD